MLPTLKYPGMIVPNVKQEYCKMTERSVAIKESSFVLFICANL